MLFSKRERLLAAKQKYFSIERKFSACLLSLHSPMHLNSKWGGVYVVVVALWKNSKKFSFYFFWLCRIFCSWTIRKDAYFSVLINFCLCSMYNLVLARFQIFLLLFLLLLLLLRYVYVCLCDSWDFILWIWNNKKSCKQIE